MFYFVLDLYIIDRFLDQAQINQPTYLSSWKEKLDPYIRDFWEIRFNG